MITFRNEMMNILHKIKKMKYITKMATGRIALRYANNNQFLLASMVINVEYIIKLFSSATTIYLIFFTNIRSKNAPDWLVIIEMLFMLVLCAVVFYTRKEALKYRAEIKSIKIKTYNKKSVSPPNIEK